MKDLRDILSELYRSRTKAEHLPDHDEPIVVDGNEVPEAPGNIYLTEEGAADPTENDGDLWFEYASQ